uniref:Serpin domain-containing protein n=1 Tax=Xiphophorus couchianus TaxID=32473 RepID=A0A3B5LID7_9TELE
SIVYSFFFIPVLLGFFWKTWKDKKNMQFKPFRAPAMGTHKLEMPFIFLLTCLCYLAPVHQAAPPNITISDLSYKNMDFAMNLYRKISSHHDNNIFFSPLSISTSFAALLMASGGVTHQEILRVLNLEQLESAAQPQLIPRLFQLLQENIAQNGSLKLDQNMALFVRQQVEVRNVFEDNLRTMALTLHCRIKNIDLLLRLTLTIYIQVNRVVPNPGAWQSPFNSDLTRDAPFYIDNYNILQVPMMVKEDKFYTAEDIPLGARLLKLPYQEGVSMLILLPNKGIDYTVIDDEISAEKFLIHTVKFLLGRHMAETEFFQPKPITVFQEKEEDLQSQVDLGKVLSQEVSSEEELSGETLSGCSSDPESTEETEISGETILEDLENPDIEAMQDGKKKKSKFSIWKKIQKTLRLKKPKKPQKSEEPQNQEHV